MKKLSLFALAAAGLFVGACSEKDEVVQEQKINQYNLIEGQSAWINVGISMPGDAITRANEDLTDGIADEYAVKSGTLYLFKGATEDAATFVQSYDITPKFLPFKDENGDNVPVGNSLGTTPSGFGEITSTSKTFVQEISSPNLGVNDKLFAYVILNDKNNVTGITATANTTTGAQFKDEAFTAIGIAAADEAKGYSKDINDAGLVMTNVPISTVAGGNSDPASAEITTFTQINADAVYKSEKEATDASAKTACIYVERAAVKVELVSADISLKLDGEDAATLTATNVKWALGNVNNNKSNGGVGYYNTRHFDNAWLSYANNAAADYLKYRMVGRTSFFASGHNTPLYRTYFAKDLNYDGTGTLGANGLNANTGLQSTQIPVGSYGLNPGDVAYTYENTFDEKSQIFRNTTYVGVEVTLPGGDFYTIEGQPNTRLKNVTDIASVVKTRLASTINSKIAAAQANIAADLAKADAAAGRTLAAGVKNVTFGIDAEVTLSTEATAYNEATGEQAYSVKLKLINVKEDGADVTDATELAKIAALVGVTAEGTDVENPANSKVYKYVGGKAYYAARIAHFGDAETPWNAPSEAFNVYYDATNPCIYPENGTNLSVDGNTAAYVYGTNRAHAWLGRWGIVRNNWYSVKITDIKGLGTPVPEDFNGEAGNTPDDNPPAKYYISAEIHILPWVKRIQNITF